MLTTTARLRHPYAPGDRGQLPGAPGCRDRANVLLRRDRRTSTRDGWEEHFVAADDNDKFYVMRNQTITCGKIRLREVPRVPRRCSGTTSAAPTSPGHRRFLGVVVGIRSRTFATAFGLPQTRAARAINVEGRGSRRASHVRRWSRRLRWRRLARRRRVLVHVFVRAQRHAPRLADRRAAVPQHAELPPTSATWSRSHAAIGSSARAADERRVHRIAAVRRSARQVHRGSQLSCTTGGTVASARTTCRRSRPTTCACLRRTQRGRSRRARTSGTAVSSTGTTTTTPTTYSGRLRPARSPPVTTCRPSDWDGDGDSDIPVRPRCRAAARTCARAPVLGGDRTSTRHRRLAERLRAVAQWSSDGQVVRRPRPAVLQPTAGVLQRHVCNNPDTLIPEHGPQHHDWQASRRTRTLGST